MRRAALLTIVLVFLLVFPAAGERTGVRLDSVSSNYWSPYPPPKPLKMVDGHWTPYSPPDPATFPEEAGAHTIQSGDSLWILAGRFYGDNLLWPFLWENNSWITDPHWIYPGDPLLIPPLVIIEKGELERVEEFEAPELAEVFLPAGSLTDMYCSFYIDDDWSSWDTFLVGSDDPWRVGHSDYNVMYINKGRADGIAAGQEYTVLRWERELRHPITREPMDDVIRMVGTVRVICTQELTSTVVVTESCYALEPGMRLRPHEMRPSPMRPIIVDFQDHCVEPFPYGRGHIIYLDYNAMAAGTWDRVAIDLGSAHGVLPGDTFLVYRDELNDDLRIPYEVYSKRGLRKYNERRYKMSMQQAEEIWDQAMPNPKTWTHFDKNKILPTIRDIETPRRTIGELVVLATREENSTAILVYARREVVAGDKIELKAGQPVK